MFSSSGRVAFYIGNYPVMKYGITLGIAITLSVFLLLIFRKKHFEKVISEDALIDLSFWVLLFGILGARCWYVLLNLQYFSKNLLEIIMINHGGISIQGAIFGGLLAGIFYSKKYNLKLGKIADLFALVVPFGQAIGRWGNFFNSEAFGKPCDLLWKLYIPENCRPFEYRNYEYFHPTFLYESITNFLIFLILYFVLRKKLLNYDGALFCFYIIFYSVFRIVIEFVRIDSVLNIFCIPVAIIVAFCFIFVSVVFLFCIFKKKNN